MKQWYGCLEKKRKLVLLRLADVGDVSLYDMYNASYIAINDVDRFHTWFIIYIYIYIWILVTFPWNLWWFNITANDLCRHWRRCDECQLPSRLIYMLKKVSTKWLSLSILNVWSTPKTKIENPRNHHLHIISLPHPVSPAIYLFTPEILHLMLLLNATVLSIGCFRLKNSTTGKGSDRVIVEAQNHQGCLELTPPFYTLNQQITTKLNIQSIVQCI